MVVICFMFERFFQQSNPIMILFVFILLLLVDLHAFAAPHFIPSKPLPANHYEINGPALCATATTTLAYLNKGTRYDPNVIHDGKILSIPLSKIKATLAFICEHQANLNNPAFVNQHFDFIRWYPNLEQVKQFSSNKPLLKNLPQNNILMTKYYVHLAKASTTYSSATPYALYGLPSDEQSLTIEAANAQPNLIRFQYGKQAILAGALTKKHVPVLAYLNREDLESALMQGTIVADFGKGISKIFNVHRNNNIGYDRVKNPYEQERYWYFKQVDGIKGYGKDAEHKITVNSSATFAADLTQFGLGKLLMVQYPNQLGTIITQAGIFADTGGAFANNLYQVDFLAGSYPGKAAYFEATQHLPNYVNAYFMVLKKEYMPV